MAPPRNQWGQYDPTRDPNSDTYIDRRTTVQTGEQTHQQVENRITADDEDQWFLPRLISRFTRDGRVQDAYSQEMSTQAAQLAQGVDTRQGPIVQCTNYMGHPHRRLQEMVTEEAEPDEVGQAGDMWIEAGNEMVKFQNSVASAINNSEADWQGSAGDSARTFMANVGNWVGAAGQSAQLAGTQTNLQSTALADAKRSMPEPVDYDPAAARADMMSSTNPLELMSKASRYQQQYNQQQAAHEEAAGVVSTYDNHLATSSTMPAWGPPPQMSNGSGETTVRKVQIERTGDDRITTGDDGTDNNDDSSNTPNVPDGRPEIPQPGPGDTDNPGDDPNRPGNDPNNPDRPNIPGDQGGGDQGGGSGGGGSGGGGGGNNTTNPSNDLPGLPPPGQFPPPGTSNQPGQNPGFPPGTPLPISAMPGPNAGEFDRGRSSGVGSGRGFGPGGMPGSSGGYGPGQGGGQGSGMGRGPGVGMGPGGAFAAEGAAMRGGAAGPRGAGIPGGMLPPGQRGEGDEDGEHQRASYLVEGDPDALFGTDEMTAPPVIGE